MNDRMSDMDSLVEVVASHRWDGVWGDNDDPVTGKFFRCSCGWVHRVDGMNGWDSWRARHDEHVARAALTAVGLPALLERVEAAEGETRQAIATGIAEVTRAQAKVADAWDEGFMTSYDMERGGSPEGDHPIAEHLTDDLPVWNPYRTALHASETP